MARWRRSCVILGFPDTCRVLSHVEVPSVKESRSRGRSTCNNSDRGSTWRRPFQTASYYVVFSSWVWVRCKACGMRGREECWERGAHAQHVVEDGGEGRCTKAIGDNSEAKCCKREDLIERQVRRPEKGGSRRQSAAAIETTQGVLLPSLALSTQALVTWVLGTSVSRSRMRSSRGSLASGLVACSRPKLTNWHQRICCDRARTWECWGYSVSDCRSADRHDKYPTNGSSKGARERSQSRDSGLARENESVGGLGVSINVPMVPSTTRQIMLQRRNRCYPWSIRRKRLGRGWSYKGIVP